MISAAIKNITEKLVDGGYYYDAMTGLSKDQYMELNQRKFVVAVVLSPQEFQRLSPIIDSKEWKNENTDLLNIFSPILSFGLKAGKCRGDLSPENYESLEKEYSDHLKLLTLLALNGVTFYDLLETLEFLFFSEFKLIEQNYESRNEEEYTVTLKLTVREMFHKLDKIKNLGFFLLPVQ